MGESSRVAPHELAFPAPARAAGGAARHSLDRWFTPLAVLPTFVVMVLVFGLPLLFSLYLSFTGWSLSQDLLGGEFVGWANYQDLLEDPAFLGSLGITFGFTAAPGGRGLGWGLPSRGLWKS